MGYRLATKVRQAWAHLDHGPYRLLLEIALALPEDSDRVWMGRDRYAEMLGKTYATDDEQRNAHRGVGRTIKALVRAGALAVVAEAKPGRNAVYQINFSATGMGTSQRYPSEGEWVPNSGTNGYHSKAPMGTTAWSEWVPPDGTPKKSEEDIEEEFRSGRWPESVISPEHTAEVAPSDPPRGFWGQTVTPKAEWGWCNEHRGDVPSHQLHRVADVSGFICDDCLDENHWTGA